MKKIRQSLLFGVCGFAFCDVSHASLGMNLKVTAGFSARQNRPSAYSNGFYGGELGYDALHIEDHPMSVGMYAMSSGTGTYSYYNVSAISYTETYRNTFYGLALGYEFKDWMHFGVSVGYADQRQNVQTGTFVTSNIGSLGSFTTGARLAFDYALSPNFAIGSQTDMIYIFQNFSGITFLNSLFLKMMF